MANSLPYCPSELPRELKKYYISASETEISEMLKVIDAKDLDDLFSDLPKSEHLELQKFRANMLPEMEYQDLLDHMRELASKNKLAKSFIGDGLPQYSVDPIIPYVSSLRGLTTAYTPYQPERSQGTLYTLWLYSNAIRMLTGFEAINASLYDRSTCLSEAINTATRLVKKSNTAIVSEGLYPGDIEVLKTLAEQTSLNIVTVPLCQKTGRTNLEELNKTIKSIESNPELSLAALAFPQVNCLGHIEDVHALTDLCWEQNIQSIAVIDPILMATNGLVPPAEFGSQKQGSHMMVGEGQHLAIGPNFGGPGLGIFGIRYNENQKTAIRSTAGRYVGKGVDEKGREALCMVLSTREQHIRREKATSNICSNQSFVASLAGASLFARGNAGLSKMITHSYEMAREATSRLIQREGIDLSFPTTPFYNEVCLTISNERNLDDLIRKACDLGIHIGVNVSNRIQDGRQHLLVSFFDQHSKEDADELINFFSQHFGLKTRQVNLETEIPQELRRQSECELPQIESKRLRDFYEHLSNLNLSPDDNIYPLGSCTMKYNPYINDYAASLEGFTNVHPQAPEKDVQGCLEILYHIQEMFKAITGLPAVTTQPVAGAQGELVGIKMFQAYHKDRGEAEQRNLILIPRSAHGTNPATATMAGFETKKVAGVEYGIVTIEADHRGQVNLDQIKEIIAKDGQRIAGIMVTNPNTAGILEYNFSEMAKIIHQAGGLVYMDGANMNAIAGYLDLNSIGVDAVHNNLHKTWTIPHGGGGPGDGIVAVSEKLIDYLPGIQVEKQKLEDSETDYFQSVRPKKSIGSFHRHYGNFAHKVRAYTYLRALGPEGVRKMSSVAVLSARYLYEKLNKTYPTLPATEANVPRMHEFILTLSKETFDHIIASGTPKSQVIPKIGKLFLDFGLHAPTVAFPEVYGLMVEPTESFSKAELDRFIEVVEAIHHLIHKNPEVLQTAPHFTPVSKVDEVRANKDLILSEHLSDLPETSKNPIDPKELSNFAIGDICERIISAHQTQK